MADMTPLGRDRIEGLPVDEAYARGIQSMGTQGPQASYPEWALALARTLGLAIPGRGGIGQPWRVQHVEDLEDLAATARHGQGFQPSDWLWRARRLAEGKPRGYEEPYTGAMAQSTDRMPLSRPRGGEFRGEVGAVSPATENDTLYNMLLRYLSESSRQ